MKPSGEKTNIYLNNAATSYPKPPCVLEAALETLRDLPPGQFRDGAHGADADLFTKCRLLLGQLLGIKDTERIYFSSGATDSLNQLLLGLGIPAEQIITTVTEHNSVLRPLHNLPGIAGEPVLLPCDENGRVSPELLEREASRGKARAVLLNHCSNVTGTIQDATSFGQIAKRYGLLFILDLSQSAGCMEVLSDVWMADAVAFTGHKSLLGLQGTGGYYIREGVPYHPFRYGGTGRESEKLACKADDPPEDAGTQNACGISALSAAAAWILETGVGRIREKELQLVRAARDMLSGIPGIRLCGGGSTDTGPVVSFIPETLDPSDLGYILSSGYGIITRTGLHCSPLIHPHIGSGRKGTVRISFSPFNTPKDISALESALKEIL